MTDRDSDPARRSRLSRVAILLTAVVGMGALSIDMFLPSLRALAAHYGTDSATAQLTVTLFPVGLAAAQLVFGPVSDRFGRRVALISGLALYTAAGLACALAPGIHLLVAARIVQAFGAGSGPVVARAIVRDVYERDRAARARALMATAQALTPILAPVLGGYLHVAFGWRSVFYVLAGFGALFLAGAIALVRETNVRRDASALTPGRLAENLRTLLGSSAYLGYVAAVSLMFCGQFAFISGSSFVLIGGLGVAPDVYGFCFGAVAVGLMVGSFTSSRLTARAGIDRMVLTGTALGATSGLAMAALAWGGARSVPAIIVPMYGFALGLGLVGPNAVAGAVGPFPHMAGLASAVLGVAQMTGSAVYGIAVGHVSDGADRPMATAIASAGIVALLAFVFARSRVAAASAPGP